MRPVPGTATYAGGRESLPNRSTAGTVDVPIPFGLCRLARLAKTTEKISDGSFSQNWWTSLDPGVQALQHSPQWCRASRLQGMHCIRASNIAARHCMCRNRKARRERATLHAMPALDAALPTGLHGIRGDCRAQNGTTDAVAPLQMQRGLMQKNVWPTVQTRRLQRRGYATAPPPQSQPAVPSLPLPCQSHDDAAPRKWMAQHTAWRGMQGHRGASLPREWVREAGSSIKMTRVPLVYVKAEAGTRRRLQSFEGHPALLRRTWPDVPAWTGGPSKLEGLNCRPHNPQRRGDAG